MQDPHGTSIRMQVPQGQVPWMVCKEGPGDLPLGRSWEEVTYIDKRTGAVVVDRLAGRAGRRFTIPLAQGPRAKGRKHKPSSLRFMFDRTLKVDYTKIGPVIKSAKVASDWFFPRL